MSQFQLSSGHITLQEQIQCVSREIALRKRCYPRWVKQGRLKEKQAQQEIERMQAVLRTLEQVAGL